MQVPACLILTFSDLNHKTPHLRTIFPAAARRDLLEAYSEFSCRIVNQISQLPKVEVEYPYND